MTEPTVKLELSLYDAQTLLQCAFNGGGGDSVAAIYLQLQIALAKRDSALEAVGQATK